MLLPDLPNPQSICPAMVLNMMKNNMKDKAGCLESLVNLWFMFLVVQTQITRHNSISNSYIESSRIASLKLQNDD